MHVRFSRMAGILGAALMFGGVAAAQTNAPQAPAGQAGLAPGTTQAVPVDPKGNPLAGADQAALQAEPADVAGEAPQPAEQLAEQSKQPAPQPQQAAEQPEQAAQQPQQLPGQAQQPAEQAQQIASDPQQPSPQVERKGPDPEWVAKQNRFTRQLNEESIAKIRSRQSGSQPQG